MIKDLRRCCLCQLHIHWYTVPLVGAYQSPVFIETVPALFIRPDHILQQLHIHRPACAADALNQSLHICPAVFVQCDTGCFRLMPQHKTQEYAQPFFAASCFFISHILSCFSNDYKPAIPSVFYFHQITYPVHLCFPHSLFLIRYTLH
jgi:hypothetical protein